MRDPTTCARVCRWWPPALLTLMLALVPAIAQGAVLREAAFDVVFTSPSHCRVTAVFAIDDAETIEHRLVVREGAVPTLTAVDGSVELAGDPAAGARALAIRLHPRAPGDQRYRLQYEVAQTAAKYRCPLWLPATPTDGRSQAVTIRVVLPDGAVRAGGTLPAFNWNGDAGSARLGHIPAFVRVPFGMAGAPPGAAGVDITRVMDTIAVVALATATGLFAWRRRRR